MNCKVVGAFVFTTNVLLKKGVISGRVAFLAYVIDTFDTVSWPGLGIVTLIGILHCLGPACESVGWHFVSCFWIDSVRFIIEEF